MSESLRGPGGFDVAPAGPLLSREISQEPDLPTYIGGLQAYYEDTAILGILKDLAGVVQPIDRDMGYLDEEASAAVAFFGGSLLGLRAVELVQGTDFVLDLNAEKVRVSVPKKENSDPLQHIHEFATAIQMMGDEGYGNAAALHEQLNEWDYLATKNIQTTAYFKRGFGWVVKIADQVVADQKLAEFSDLMASLGLVESDFAHIEQGFDR